MATNEAWQSRETTAAAMASMALDPYKAIKKGHLMFVPSYVATSLRYDESAWRSDQPSAST